MESDESGTAEQVRALAGRRAKGGPGPMVVRVVDVTDLEVRDPSAVLDAARQTGWSGDEQDVPGAVGWLMAHRAAPTGTETLANTGQCRPLDSTNDELADQAHELRAWLAAGTHEPHPAAS